MALLAFSTGMWVIASVFIAYKPDSGFITAVNRLIYVFGILLLTSLFQFTLVFPYRLHVFDRYHWILLYVPAAIFSIIAVSTNAVVEDTVSSPTIAGRVIGGPVYIHYNLYLFLLYVLSIVVMVRRLPRLDGIHLNIARIMVVAIILGGLPAVVIDLIIPTVAPHIVPNYLYGNLFTAVWLGATSYVVMRRV